MSPDDVETGGILEVRDGLPKSNACQALLFVFKLPKFSA